MRAQLGAVAIATATLALMAASPPTGADEPMTRAQADQIISELRQIRGLLERSAVGRPLASHQ